MISCFILESQEPKCHWLRVALGAEEFPELKSLQAKPSNSRERLLALKGTPAISCISSSTQKAGCGGWPVFLRSLCIWSPFVFTTSMVDRSYLTPGYGSLLEKGWKDLAVYEFMVRKGECEKACILDRCVGSRPTLAAFAESTGSALVSFPPQIHMEKL